MPRAVLTRPVLRDLGATILVGALLVTSHVPAAAHAATAEAPASADDDPSSTGAHPGVLLEPQAYPGHVFTGGMALDRAQVAGLMSMALGLPAGTVDPFHDDEGVALEAAINSLAGAGLTEGCGPGAYCPRERVTRGQFAVLLERAVPQPHTGEDFFHDDQGAFFEGAVNRLAAAGIVFGCGTDRFCPYGAVTRGQASTMLSRVLGSSFSSTDPVERWRPVLAVWFSPTDIGRALDVIRCESKGDPTARNPSSGASGLFQHIPRYWPDRSADAGMAGRSIFDPDANSAVAAWLVYHDGGWRHWNASAYCWN